MRIVSEPDTGVSGNAEENDTDRKTPGTESPRNTQAAYGH